MKVLIVCKGTANRESFKKMKPFVYEQMKELKKLDVELDVFLIEKNGLIGYLRSRKALIRTIESNKYDLIHAHYGLAGLFAASQFRIPVIVSFIGSDINNIRIRLMSRLAMILSVHNIFVSKELQLKSKVKKKYSIIPYGVDFTDTVPMEKIFARSLMKIPKDEVMCLFGSSRYRKIKNFSLAERAVRLCDNVKLRDLNGNYDKDKVISLINACDCVLLTSFNEGSPQIIKEALACNVPIVTTDVGDVRIVIGNTDGCYICSYKADDVADNIKKAIAFGRPTKGRNNIHYLNNKHIAKQIMSIYKSVL